MLFTKKLAGAILVATIVQLGWVAGIARESVAEADFHSIAGAIGFSLTWLAFMNTPAGRIRYLLYLIGIGGICCAWYTFIEERRILEYSTIASALAVLAYLTGFGIIIESSDRSKAIAWSLGGMSLFLLVWGFICFLTAPGAVRRPTMAFSTPKSDSAVVVVLDDKGKTVTKDTLNLAPGGEGESLPKLRTVLGSAQPSLTAMPPGCPPNSSLGKLFLSAKAEYGGGLEIFEQSVASTSASPLEEAEARARELQSKQLFFPRSTLPNPTRAFVALVELSKTHTSSWNDVVQSVPGFAKAIPELFKTIPASFPEPQYMLAPLMTALDDFQRQLTRFNEILGHAFASILRVGVGFFFAMALGIPFGLAIGSFAKLNSLVNSVIQALRPISPIAWLPVATISLGGGTLAAFFLIFLSSFFAIVISAAAAVATLDLKYRRSAMNFGIRGYEFARCVLVPACMPSILTSLRVAVGIAWIVIVAAEMLGVEQGLGYLVLDARNQLNYDRVVAAMIVIGIIGLSIDLIFRHFERIVLERRGMGVR